MKQPSRPWKIYAAMLAGLAVMLAVVFIAASSLAQDGPGPVVLRYAAALDRHDLPAANALLSTTSQPWPLNTPAEQHGGRCFQPAVAKIELAGALGEVTLRCTNQTRAPTYAVVKDADSWKIHKISIR